MSDAGEIYREMKSFYKKDFGAYLNHVSGFSQLLAEDMVEPFQVEEIMSYIRNGLKNVKIVYESFTPEMAEQEHFREIRDVSEMITVLEENVEYVLDNYMNEFAKGDVINCAKNIQMTATSINEKGSAWRKRINDVGKVIGIDKDIWYID